jgi:UPF0755 protein
MKRVIGRLLIVIVVLGALAVSVGLWYRQRVSTPYRGFVTDEVFVDLPPGTSMAAIANRLAEAGVIPDAWTFRLAARLTGSDRKLKAGEYRFADAGSPASVMARLVAGDVFTRAVTFPEGLTIAEMSGIFAKSGLGGAEAFTRAAADPSLVRAWDPQARSLEGYLFPDTYAWPRRADAGEAVRAMVAGFNHAFDAALRAEAAARGLEVRDVVTLASIIEKETGSAGERPLVSAVYHNRLKIGMPLQCDPTVIYALMLAGRWDGNLRKDDLALRSPYNTYVVRGLPPGPIASPGRASLDAAIHPADVKYLYFVSRNDGTHVFAATLAEHNRNVAAFQGKGKGQRAKGKGN